MIEEPIAKGYWYRVESGPHRGKEGVCDLIKTERSGVTYYRLGHPYERVPVGRFRAEQLRRISPPAFVSKLTEEQQNDVLSVIMAQKK